MKTIKIISGTLIAGILVYSLTGFRDIPKDTKAVKPFDQKRYLGTWYEIARMDYKWERHLNNVTATYSLREDGKIKVDNKGYNYDKNKWEESVGKAKPASDPNVGELKVSFFGPFYSEYNVIAVDENYKYALVAGSNTKYLWILSREKTIPEHIKMEYLKKAKSVGYKIEDLVWVEHNK